MSGNVLQSLYGQDLLGASAAGTQASVSSFSTSTTSALASIASTRPYLIAQKLPPATPLIGGINLSPDQTKLTTEQFQTEISTAVRIGSRLYVISSGGGGTLQVADASSAAKVSLVGRTPLSGYTSQAVASFETLLAVALSPADYATNGGKGVIRFYRVNITGKLTKLADITVGYLPDSIAFNADGTKLVIANEGEPISGYATDRSKDPAGSIGIIDIDGRTAPRFSYTDLRFDATILPTGIRISGPSGTTQATDIEPEYVSILGNYAYVTLQENNGVAKVNLTTKVIEKVFALGTVDYSTLLVDLSDKDGVSGSSTFAPKLGQNFEGLRMADGIAAYSTGGKDYFVTANEGDGREYGVSGTANYYIDEIRGSGSSSSPDTTAYRVKRLVDDATVGRSDRVTTFGGRSISIFDADSGALVWDSGNSLQTIAVAAGVYDDTRSDDKGVEPEGIVVAQLNGRSYAIVGMERTTSSMLAVFDITVPAAVKFITSSVIPGSISPEGLHIIEAAQSPTGRSQLLVSNEISNSFNIFDLEALICAPPVAGAGTFKSTMLKDVAGGSDLQVTSLLTVGEITNGFSPGSVYAAPGIFDGTGAYDNQDGTYTVFVNSELAVTKGYQYQVSYANAAGVPATVKTITGSRISQFIVQKDVDNNALNGYQSRIISGGLAYDKVIGSDSDGFDRFCSATLFEANQFGAGMGFANRLYLTGEETSTGPGGAMYVLDPATRTLWEAQSLGRGTWENATLVDTGSADTVGVLLFDDSTAPLYLWVGTKNAGGDLLDQNGLKNGNLYAWKPGAEMIPEAGTDATAGPDSDDLKAMATGRPIGGGWVLLGDQTYVLGKTATQLRASAVAAGAMQFSRVEDGDTNPLNGKQVVFNTTGSSAFGNGDLYGNVITLDFANAFGPNGQLNGAGSTVLKVMYDGDKLTDPTTGLRSPDNLTWSADGFIYVQEDRTVSPWGAVDGSIWKLAPGNVDPITGQAVAERWAVIDRPLPYSQTDALAIGAAPGYANSGEWESSGIIDVSKIYGLAPGSMFLADVQGHGLRNANLWGDGYLVEGGQLDLIRQTPGLI